MTRVSTGHEPAFPLFPSFLLSTGIHLVAILLILFSPSWGTRGYHKAPRTFMVNLVAVPSLSGGMAPAAPAPSASPSSAPKTKEAKKVVVSKPAKESRVAELKRTEEIQPPPRSRPPIQAKETPVPRVKGTSLPPSAPKAQRAPPPVPTFNLPPLPSGLPREQTAHLQSGGVSGTGGQGTGATSTPASSSSSGNAATGDGQSKSGKAEGLLGVASLLPGVSVDNPDFQFTYYLVIIQSKIASNWNPPFSGGKTDRRPKTLLHFRILRNGQVRDVRVETSSGASLLDQSAVRAISMSNPLPPLPQRFLDDSLGVHFSFELEGERG